MPCDKIVDIGQGLAHISSQSHKESILVIISIFFLVVSWSVRLPYDENVIWSVYVIYQNFIFFLKFLLPKNVATAAQKVQHPNFDFCSSCLSFPMNVIILVLSIHTKTGQTYQPESSGHRWNPGC